MFSPSPSIELFTLVTINVYKLLYKFDFGNVKVWMLDSINIYNNTFRIIKSYKYISASQTFWRCLSLQGYLLEA